MNITEPAFDANISVQDAPFTYVARRQDHVLFTAEATVDFHPYADGEEAGLSIFLNRAQHFDFGVVGISNKNLTQSSSNPRRFARLLTVTLNSTDAGANDPVSKPGILPLPASNSPVRLRVQTLTRSTFTFSYKMATGNGGWTTVGFGDATQVSGGFTGVRQTYAI